MKSDVVIIYDWDDTLFPTSWIMRQGIKISELADVNKYIVYFHELDDVVYELLKASILLGDVYIITNANIQWIKLSKRLLRKSSQLIDKYVNIISARDNYKEMYDMDEWKIHREIDSRAQPTKSKSRSKIVGVAGVGNMVDAYQNRNDFYTFKTEARSTPR